MNNDFDNKDINKDNDKEIDNGAENDINIQEGEKESSQIPEGEEKAAREEEKDNREEAQDLGEKGDTARDVGKGSNVGENKTYYANYEPPYYTPDFTIVDKTDAPSAEPKKEERKTFSRGAVVALCAVTVALSVLLSALAGAVARGDASLELGSKDKNIVNIITSDREIVVEEIEGNADYDNLTVAQVAALVSKQVVEITTAQKKTNGSYIVSGAGSGVIFSQSGNIGYIMTNYHVIGDVVDIEGKITVKIKNEANANGYEEYTASYVAGDEREDLAVLAVTTKEGHTLSCADITDSSKLSVGEQVVAIGNPLGTLGGTVTNGIISALDREITVGNYPMTLLQTNAAINPGNSGGGLFDMKGKLIGIVNAKQSSTGIEGLGFAIPSNIVKKAYKDLLEHGYIRDRAALGISIQQYVNNYFGTTAIYVAKSSSDGALKEGDLLVSVNGTRVSSMSDCYFALKNVKVGDTVEVVVERNSLEVKVSVTTVEYNPTVQ